MAAVKRFTSCRDHPEQTANQPNAPKTRARADRSSRAQARAGKRDRGAVARELFVASAHARRAAPKFVKAPQSRRETRGCLWGGRWRCPSAMHKHPPSAGDPNPRAATWRSTRVPCTARSRTSLKITRNISAVAGVASRGTPGLPTLPSKGGRAEVLALPQSWPPRPTQRSRKTLSGQVARLAASGAYVCLRDRTLVGAEFA